MKIHSIAGYGYSEFIENTPAESPEAVKRYYYRMGNAFALFHALGSSDLHFENFIAAGEYPALVDLETIVTPAVKLFLDKELFPDIAVAEDSFITDSNISLLQSALLPCFSK